MNITLNNAVHALLQFTDSACPVGAFAFSCGLESAVAGKIVTSKQSLRDFTHAIATQSVYSDAIAGLIAHRATINNDYKQILDADAFLFSSKMNEESRSMLRKMGRKLCELVIAINPCETTSKLLEDIKTNVTPGCYPVVQGVCFALFGINEHNFFISHQYGVINMVLNAALRCVKVSHIETQQILFDLMQENTPLYDEIKDYNLNEIHSFFPMIDLMASIHEKGTQRMFMS